MRCDLKVMRCDLKVMRCDLRVMRCGVRVMRCDLRVMRCDLKVLSPLTWSRVVMVIMMLAMQVVYASETDSQGEDEDKMIRVNETLKRLGTIRAQPGHRQGTIRDP